MLDMGREIRRRLIRNAAWRRLLLDPETGKLSRDGETVLDDLISFTRFFKDTEPEPLQLARVEGSRQVVRHILKCTRTTEQLMKRQINKETEPDE